MNSVVLVGVQVRDESTSINTAFMLSDHETLMSLVFDEMTETVW
jgi:hypothetical protein